MYICVIRHKPCSHFLAQSGDEFKHVGFRVENGVLTHLVWNGRLRKVVCRENCPITKLISKSYIVSISYVSGYFRFAIVVRRQSAYGPCFAPYRLNLAEREVEALRLFSSHSIKGAAEKLGVSKAATSKLVKRAVRKLLALVGEWSSRSA